MMNAEPTRATSSRRPHLDALYADGNVTTVEAARFRGVEKSTVRRECDALNLPSKRIRGRRTIPIKALREYRDAHTIGRPAQ